MFTIILGVLAGVLQIGGYLLYSKKITDGKIKPDTATWSIWAFGAVLESASYIWLTGDWVKNILPIACAISAMALFLYCFKRGHFGKIDRFDKILVIGDIIAIIVWWLSQSAFYANALLVLTGVISFIPIIRHTWNNPKIEKATPWFIWTAAYAILGIVVVLRYEKWEDLLYPITFIVCHLIVAILALDSRISKTLRFK